MEFIIYKKTFSPKLAKSNPLFSTFFKIFKFSARFLQQKKYELITPTNIVSNPLYFDKINFKKLNSFIKKSNPQKKITL